MKSSIIWISFFLNLSLALAVTDRPVIGVMTTVSMFKSTYPAGNYSYIPSLYVKYLESAGARVVPIPYDASPSNLTFLLNQVNGLFFIGGGSDLNYTDPVTGKIGPSNITTAGTFLVDRLIEANRNGDYFPLMTTCEGWEILLFALSRDYNIMLTNYTDINVQSNIELTPSAYRTRLWGQLPDDLKKAVHTDNLFLYDHNNAITPEAFTSNELLNQYMEITAISKSVNGGPDFVASAQGRQFPIYGNQYHPEKTVYMWKNNVNAPHSPDAISLAQYLINAFVDDTRQNDRKFISEDILQKSLIYNWNTSHVSNVSKSFDWVYLFPTVSQHPEKYPALFN